MVLLLAGLVSAGELDIAREALRDGLWEVARTHAAKVEGPEAKLVTVESYAREGRWKDVLKTLEANPDETGDAFVYYRALALARTGTSEAAAAAETAAAPAAAAAPRNGPRRHCKPNFKKPTERMNPPRFWDRGGLCLVL